MKKSFEEKSLSPSETFMVSGDLVDEEKILLSALILILIPITYIK